MNKRRLKKAVGKIQANRRLRGHELHAIQRQMNRTAAAMGRAAGRMMERDVARAFGLPVD